MINLVLFGPPGSGKGTQAKKLMEKYGLVHVSTGDLFRYELGNNTELGQLARSFMDRGELVPDEVTTQMLIRRVDELQDAQGIIFDGYPRNINQAQSLEAILEEKETELSCLLSLKVEDDEIVRRILTRGEQSGRADDQNERIIRNRISIYKEQTQPVFAYFDAYDKSISIDGVGSIDEVFEGICKVIDHFIEEDNA